MSCPFGIDTPVPWRQMACSGLQHFIKAYWLECNSSIWDLKGWRHSIGLMKNLRHVKWSRGLMLGHLVNIRKALTCLHYTTTFIAFNMWQVSQGYRGGGKWNSALTINHLPGKTKTRCVWCFFSDPSHWMSGKKKHLGLFIYLFKTTSIKQEQMLLYKSCLQQQNCEQVESTIL